MLEIFFFDLVAAAVRSVLGTAVAERPKVRSRPDPARVEATASEYRAWARERGLTLDSAARGYRGTLARHAVLLRPGLDGSAPIGVEVEIDVPLAQARSALLTASDRGTQPIEQALASLFDDEQHAEAMRSIALVPRGIRVRFAALTKPRVVARTSLELIALVEPFATREPGAPYR